MNSRIYRMLRVEYECQVVKGQGRKRGTEMTVQSLAGDEIRYLAIAIGPECRGDCER